MAEGLKTVGFNLSSYIQRYHGNAKIAHLKFILSRRSECALEAFVLYANELKNGYNTDAYCELAELYPELCSSSNVILDMDWASATAAKALETLDRLESELSALKNTGINESIVAVLSDIAHLLDRRGNSAAAVKYFLKIKDMNCSSKQVCDAMLNIARIYLNDGDFRSARLFAMKTDNVTELDAVSLFLRDVVFGVSSLGESKFENAFRSFDAAATQIPTLPENNLLIRNFPVDMKDVAVFGTLCALVSLSAKDIRDCVLHGQFKKLFDSVPSIRALVLSFVQNRFADCMEYLNAHRIEWYHSKFLSSQVDTLLSSVSERLIANYCMPFNVMELNKIAMSFKYELDVVETIIIRLISSKVLPFKLDCHTKTLHRITPQKQNVYESVNETVDEALRDVRRGILRLSMLQSGFAIDSNCDAVHGGSHKVDKVDAPLSPNSMKMDVSQGFNTDDDEC